MSRPSDLPPFQATAAVYVSACLPITVLLMFAICYKHSASASSNHRGCNAGKMAHDPTCERPDNPSAPFASCIWEACMVIWRA
jgi:hypothetical protein